MTSFYNRLTLRGRGSDREPRVSDSLDMEIARSVSKTSGALDAAAESIAAEVRARARTFQNSGDFADSIQVKTSTYQRVRDRIVYSDDPGAKSIEYGYRDRGGTFRPGHFVFSRTADKYNSGGGRP